MKTTRLNTTLVTPVWRSRRRWFDLPVPAAACIVITCLICIGLIVGRMRSMPSVVLQPTPALPAAPLIVIQKERVPVLAPTPDMALQQAVEQLRARVAELEQRDVAPAVVYVAQEAPQEAPQPAIAPEVCYHAERQAMVNGVSVGVGIGDSCTTQQQADQQATDAAFTLMNAPAAPTPEPQAAQVLTERQRNIQGRLANEGITMPFADTPEQREQNRVQLCAEHPEWLNCQ